MRDSHSTEGLALLLDPVIHAPIRLQVMSAVTLLSDGGHDFADLKKITGATDGNLGAHITTLEAAGYVTVKKSFKSKRPRTTVAATAAGRKAYAGYVDALRRVIFPSPQP